MKELLEYFNYILDALDTNNMSLIIRQLKDCEYDDVYYNTRYNIQQIIKSNKKIEAIHNIRCYIAGIKLKVENSDPRKLYNSILSQDYEKLKIESKLTSLYHLYNARIIAIDTGYDMGDRYISHLLAFLSRICDQ